MNQFSSSWKTLLAKARDCNTKEQWWQLLSPFVLKEQTLVFDPIALKKIFHLLKSDRISSNYDYRIWYFILESCIEGWDLKLAEEVCEHCSQFTQPEFILLIAETYISRSKPETARKLAMRGIKMKITSEECQAKLYMLIALSYSEQRLTHKAKKELDFINHKYSHLIQEKKSIDLLEMMSRVYFSLGDYLKSGEFNELAANQYALLPQKFNEAAMAYINAAANYGNYFVIYLKIKDSPHHEKQINYLEKALHNLEKAKKFADLTNNHKIQYAYYVFLCINEAKYGNLESGKKYIKQACEIKTEKDTTKSNLYNLSVKIGLFLANGQLHLAEKNWHELSELLKSSQSERFLPTYIKIHSDILWEQERFSESIDLVKEHLKHFKFTDKVTPTDISFFSYFFQKCFIMGVLANQKYENNKIEKMFPSQILNLSEYDIYQLIATKEFKNAFVHLKNKIERNNQILGAKKYALESIYPYELILICILNDAHLHLFKDEFLVEFKKCLKSIGKSRYSILWDLFNAAFSYQSGDLRKTEKHLNNAIKFDNCCIVERKLAKNILAKLKNVEQEKILDPNEVQFLDVCQQLYFPTLNK